MAESRTGTQGLEVSRSTRVGDTDGVGQALTGDSTCLQGLASPGMRHREGFGALREGARGLSRLQGGSSWP